MKQALILLAIIASIALLSAQVVVTNPTTEYKELDWAKIKTHEDTVLVLQIIAAAVAQTNGTPIIMVFTNSMFYTNAQHLLK